MKSRLRFLPLAALLTTLLSGCVTPSSPVIRHNAEAISATPTTSTGAVAGTESPSPVQPRISAGTGMLINERAAAEPPPNLGSTGQATFNFEGESLQAVVKAILGDLLQQNYVIAPGVQGTVTLGTPKPVSAAQALSLLEMVLGWNNARLVWSDGRYNIVPADQALAGNLAPRTGAAADARGYEVRAVPLRYISATEMEKLLKPYARDKAIVQVDASRNMIVIAGSRAELQNYLRTIEIFDVDWLAGMSVGVYPLQSGDAGKMVTELEKVFGEGGKTPLSGMFRFMPLDAQNAVMVITPQAAYLKEIQAWIERMDAGGDGARLYVYEVKFMKAADLAEQLASVFGGGSSQRPANDVSLMPSMDPVEVRTTDNTQDISRGPTLGSAPAANSPATLNVDGDQVNVSAVAESNSLLVRASPAHWESIRRAIDRLDEMPLQVHIEAQVVEVKLTGELSYGVSWFFGNAITNGGTPPVVLPTPNDWGNPSASVSGTGGGSFTFLGPSAQAILKTLDSVSDLRVLSAPSVLVRNNVEADFSAGTQIPVASTVINNNGNTNSDNTFSQVQFRQTGVSLRVRPRVSSNGMVFMEITQDVSSPSASGPVIGGNVSVDNRKLHTEVAVQTGETVVLAGLIKTEQGKGSSGIPFLSRIPVVGGLFGSQNQSNNRSEVLVLITPTVVRDPAEARRLTDEYGERFRALDPLRKASGATTPHH